MVRAERSTIRLVTADTTGLVRARARCVRIGVSQPPEKNLGSGSALRSRDLVV